MYTGGHTLWSYRRKEKNALLIDIAVPGDARVEEKEEEKVMKCEYLTREVKRLWQLRTPVQVIAVIVGALATFPKKLELYVEKGGIEVSVGLLQKVALLGTAGILRRVFGEDAAV